MPQSKTASRSKTTPPARTKAKAPGSIRVVQAPSATGESIRSFFRTLPGPSKYPGSQIVHGLDLISPINLTNATGASVTYPIATSLFNTEMSPTGDVLEGTRLYKIGSTFEKFLFRRMKFHYQPVCASTTNGGVILAYESDPTDSTPPANVHGFQAYTAQRDNVQCNVWQRSTLDVPGITSPDAAYFTSPNSTDERLYFQGQIYVATSSPITLAASTSLALGNLWLEYEVIFYDPTIESNLTFVAQTGTVPLSITTTNQTTSVLPSTTLPGLNATITDSSGRFSVDGALGRLYLKGAGDLTAAFSGILQQITDNTYTGSTVRDYVLPILNGGPGVTISSNFSTSQTAAPPSAPNQSVQSGVTNLWKIFVDPFSAPSDRWIWPGLNYFNYVVSSGLTRNILNAAFSVTRPPVAPRYSLPSNL